MKNKLYESYVLVHMADGFDEASDFLNFRTFLFQILKKIWLKMLTQQFRSAHSAKRVKCAMKLL